jgi:hypothetical protein
MKDGSVQRTRTFVAKQQSGMDVLCFETEDLEIKGMRTLLVELGGNWSQKEELLYCVFYVKSLNRQES